MTDPRTTRLAQFYASITPASLTQIPDIYAADARFKDPFNDVHGHRDITRVFAHMFDTVTEPRFEVLSAHTQGDEAWLTWNFHLQRANAPLVIHGATRILFDAQGRVALHRDYWDPAEELYSKVPVLGAFIRWLTRRLSATR